ncbi:MAG: glycoside hydrolase family 3 protein, partial [Spirochaetaceae bacterium]|nr:glycoside hydrolase family 3 protein [Spirochaetaceae bacterium]
DPTILAQQIESAMTDQEVLGQVLMFGYPTEGVDPNIIEWIRDEGLGGVKIFGWNANNLGILAETVGRYQNTARTGRFGVPLLIATDQEGGWVRHVKGESSVTPGNMALGADNLPYDAWMTGLLLGRELAAVGVNMNFAPTVDVFVDPKADVIGPRAFMADPQMTGIMGLSFARGHEEAGVISTAKHFPGHGDTEQDSHGTLPRVTANLETLMARDLVPYRIMIAGGVPAIMTGHLAFPSITGNEIPATLSEALLTDLLRDELGFEGVAVTDDLFMRGARTDGAPLHEVCYRSLRAGADILLVSQGEDDFRSIHSRLITEMTDDVEFNKRVREAARRVLKMKAAWLKRPDGVPLNPDPDAVVVPSDGAPEFFLEQAARSITLVNDTRFPVSPQNAGDVLLAGSYNEFFTEGLLRYPDARTWRLEYEDTRAGLERRGRELLRAARRYDTVIVLLPDEEISILLDELEPIAEKVVVISVLSPAHLNSVQWAQTSLAAYGTGRDSFRAVFAALAGDYTPRGRLPIPLDTVQ